MGLKIGETIKRLRREKDITQERLADYLNVSPQAISKWETGLAHPDITFIPALVHIFGITTDILFGIDEDCDRARIDAIIAKFEQLNMEGRMDENLSMLKDALQEFPNDFRLLSAYTSILFSIYGARGDRSLLEETISKSELILQDCTDDELRYQAIQLLTYSYHSKGWTDKAVSMANRIPKYINREKLMSAILEGDAKISAIENEIYISFSDLQFNIEQLSKLFVKKGDNQGALQLMAISNELYSVIAAESVDFMIPSMAWFHREYAVILAKFNMKDEALDNLRIAAKFAIHDTEDRSTDNILFSKMDRSGWKGGKNYTESEAELLLKRLEQPAFDGMRNLKYFEEICTVLRQHIGGLDRN